MYDILFNPSSSCHVGTMCSNMNAANQVNAKTKNVLDNFNYCKTYVKLENAAYICTATMQHFGMNSIDEKAETFIPPTVLNGDKADRRIWLHSQVKCILQKHVMNEQKDYYGMLQKNLTEANEPKPEFYFCSIYGKKYKYAKAKVNHEAKVHSTTLTTDATLPKQQPSMEQKEVDPRYNYACARLSLGMMIFNFEDAVKEGDGERIIRCWKFMTLLFRAYNHTKYALAGLELQLNLKALLTPYQSHSLTWNRSVNTKGGKGKNIALDLRLEQLNKVLKDMLRCLGVNINEKSAQRCSQSIKPMDAILANMDAKMHLKKPTGKHILAKRDNDFKIILKELSERGEVFTCKPSPERMYKTFPNFNRNILCHIDFKLLNKWINQHMGK